MEGSRARASRCPRAFHFHPRPRCRARSSVLFLRAACCWNGWLEWRAWGGECWRRDGGKRYRLKRAVGTRATCGRVFRVVSARPVFVLEVARASAGSGVRARQLCGLSRRPVVCRKVVARAFRRRPRRARGEGEWGEGTLIVERRLPRSATGTRCGSGGRPPDGGRPGRLLAGWLALGHGGGGEKRPGSLWLPGRQAAAPSAPPEGRGLAGWLAGWLAGKRAPVPGPLPLPAAAPTAPPVPRRPRLRRGRPRGGGAPGQAPSGGGGGGAKRRARHDRDLQRRQED